MQKKRKKKKNVFYNYRATDWHPKQFEDTKEVTSSRESKKDTQYNGRKNPDKGTNSDLQNAT